MYRFPSARTDYSCIGLHIAVQAVLTFATISFATARRVTPASARGSGILNSFHEEDRYATQASVCLCSFLRGHSGDGRGGCRASEYGDAFGSGYGSAGSGGSRRQSDG